MKLPFYVGSYSMPSPWVGAPDASGVGVTLASLDLGSGALDVLDNWPYANPAFLVAEPLAQRLYAVTELEHSGELVSWRVGADLRLAERSAIDTGRDGPGHVTIDRARSVAFVTQFGGGGLSVIELDADGAPRALVDITDLPSGTVAADGSESISRPHCSRLLDGSELLVTDFGRDVVALYSIHGAGSATALRLEDALRLPPGSAPRHIALSRSGSIAYISNEGSASVSIVRIHRAGTPARLELVEVVPSLGLGREASLPAEIAAHPELDVIYMANRRDESISIFEAERASGYLVERAAIDVEGSWPRHFAVAPDGKFVVVGDQRSGSLHSFRVDSRGRLDRTGYSAAVASPTSIAFWLG